MIYTFGAYFVRTFLSEKFFTGQYIDNGGNGDFAAIPVLPSRARVRVK